MEVLVAVEGDGTTVGVVVGPGIGLLVGPGVGVVVGSGIGVVVGSGIGLVVGPGVGVFVGSGIREEEVDMGKICEGLAEGLVLWTEFSKADSARYTERSIEVARNRDKRVFSCIAGPLQSAFRGWLMTNGKNVFSSSLTITWHV